MCIMIQVMKKTLNVPHSLREGDEFIHKSRALHAKITIKSVDGNNLRVKIVPLDRPVNLYSWEETWDYNETLKGFMAINGRVNCLTK